MGEPLGVAPKVCTYVKSKLNDLDLRDLTSTGSCLRTLAARQIPTQSHRFHLKAKVSAE